MPAEIPSVDWWITSRCNLACDFCYGPVPAADPIERRTAVLEALAASSARVVTLCGGEPMLVRKVDEFAATLAGRGKSTVLNTNGELMRTRFDQGFRLGTFDLVGISIEGSTAEMHRSMRGPKADLDRVIEAARLVKKEPGVRLKLATVVSGVNRDDLPRLAGIVRDLEPDVWRLYQYSRRGGQNTGQDRHTIAVEEFRQLARLAAEQAAPVRTAPSAETDTEGCLIVDPEGNVLQPEGDHYVRRGNCLQTPLDDIWEQIPARATIVENKRWLSVLS